MGNIDWEWVNEIIDKQIGRFKKKFRIDELKKQVMKNKMSALQIEFKNGKIISKRLDPGFKENRKRHLENFLTNVAKKYPEINTTIYCNVWDWSCKEDKEYPIFVMSAFKGTKNLIIPDYLFMRDYSKRNGRNNDEEPQDKIIKKYRNGNWEDKKSKCFFRAGTSKNKVIIKMFENHPTVDAKWSRDGFLTYEEMFSHKYVISHYMRWDSIYFFMKSNILIFLYSGFNQYLWYDLFLQSEKNYLSFNDQEEFNKKFKLIDKNPKMAKLIINNTNEIANTYFRYDFAIDYVGKLLIKYQTLIYEPSKCDNSNIQPIRDSPKSN